MTKATTLAGIKLSENIFTSKTKILCESCATRGCENYAASYCRDYTITIPFKQSAKGLEIDRFNTFRLGDAWAKRVVPGMRVALSRHGKVVKYATVENVFNGDKLEMAKMFAKDNHTIMSIEVNESAEQKMLKLLKNTCGTRSFNHYKTVTVIYLNTVD